MMTRTATRLTTAVENYLTDLKRVRASGGGTGERSSYGPLANLHIANAPMRSQIERVCRQSGYGPPIICTPNELMEPNHEAPTA